MRFAADEVITARPVAGSSVRTGSVVTLVPSLGPRPVKVPGLAHLTVPEATTELGDKLVLGPRHQVYSDTFGVGEIVRQDPQAGNRVGRGSEVEVWVSKGPPPKPVPKVVELSREQATEALTTAGFHVGVTERFSDSVERGYVIAQDPAAKTRLQPTQTVTITVSLGPRQFPMPNVVGMGKDAAIAKLNSLGLDVHVALVQVPTPKDVVVYQEPGAGATVRYGQSVTIYVA
jgi:serine/threonine-protein kinase